MTNEGVQARQLFYEGTIAYKSGRLRQGRREVPRGPEALGRAAQGPPRLPQRRLQQEGHRPDRPALPPGPEAARRARAPGHPVPRPGSRRRTATITLDPFDAIEMLGPTGLDGIHGPGPRPRAGQAAPRRSPRRGDRGSAAALAPRQRPREPRGRDRSRRCPKESRPNHERDRDPHDPGRAQPRLGRRLHVLRADARQARHRRPAVRPPARGHRDPQPPRPAGRAGGLGRQHPRLRPPGRPLRPAGLGLEHGRPLRPDADHPRADDARRPARAGRSPSRAR